MSKRKATKIVRGSHAIDGAGVHLARVLGNHTMYDFDPFLMLDGFDSTNPEDYIKGFPFHPHRGIETVTYLVNGSMEHQDSMGNKGVISDGDCQWMTAGSGIIHQEMPSASERMLGAQLWVNLPKKDKMADPAYGDLHAKDIPVVQEDGAVVRVLSGSYKETKGYFVPKYVDVTYIDFELAPGKEFTFEGTPNDETLFVYLLNGTLAVNETLDDFEKKGAAVLFKSSTDSAGDRDEVVFKAGEDGARLILLSGKPLKEPIAWGGPIVMNTREELMKAFDELNDGTFIKHAR